MSKKIKILLVDNDVDIVDLNKAILENNNYEVVTAFSGREGLNKLKVEQPDLVVLDLMMEKHDSGFAFAKQIKADPVYKSTPIIMLSSVAEQTGFEFTQEQDGYWMKTNDFLKKPVTANQLLAKVEELLKKAEK